MPGEATGQRYQTAQQLADELNRFLNDEPIVVQSLSWTNFDKTLWVNSEYMHGYLGYAEEIIPERRYLFQVVRSFLRYFARGESLRICDLAAVMGRWRNTF